MKTNRRTFLEKAMLGAAGGIAAPFLNFNKENKEQKKEVPRNMIGVSSYSFWQFNGPKEETSIEYCIEQAAEMGFDGQEDPKVAVPKSLDLLREAFTWT